MALTDGPPRELLELCAGLPEAVGEGDQHVGFTVRGRRFAWYLDDHHDDGRVALVFKAPPGINRQLVADDPDRFFIPAYVGARGWAGVWLDVADIKPGRVPLRRPPSGGTRTWVPSETMCSIWRWCQ